MEMENGCRVRLQESPGTCGHVCTLADLSLQEVVHTIGPSSPLASWLEQGGLSADADSEIVVVVSWLLVFTLVVIVASFKLPAVGGCRL